MVLCVRWRVSIGPIHTLPPLDARVFARLDVVAAREPDPVLTELRRDRVQEPRQLSVRIGAERDEVSVQLIFGVLPSHLDGVHLGRVPVREGGGGGRG